MNRKLIIAIALSITVLFCYLCNSVCTPRYRVTYITYMYYSQDSSMHELSRSTQVFHCKKEDINDYIKNYEASNRNSYTIDSIAVLTIIRNR